MESHTSIELTTGRFTEYDDDGFLNLQIDGFFAPGLGGTGLEEVLHPWGFDGRVPDQDAGPAGTGGLGCWTLVHNDGTQTRCVQLNDPRMAPVLPPLEKGSSRQYGATGSRIVVDGVTGDVKIEHYDPAQAAGLAVELTKLALTIGGSAAVEVALAPLVLAELNKIVAAATAAAAAAVVQDGGKVAFTTFANSLTFASPASTALKST